MHETLGMENLRHLIHATFFSSVFENVKSFTKDQVALISFVVWRILLHLRQIRNICLWSFIFPVREVSNASKWQKRFWENKQMFGKETDVKSCRRPDKYMDVPQKLPCWFKRPKQANDNKNLSVCCTVLFSCIEVRMFRAVPLALFAQRNVQDPHNWTKTLNVFAPTLIELWELYPCQPSLAVVLEDPVT